MQEAPSVRMRIAVIGAGAAGLAALRRISEVDGFEADCYEKTDKVGGTWVYVPETGRDAYGLPVHSSMYDSLRTNLPKEVMGYPGYPIPESPKSYLSRTEILNFLNDFCDHFKVRDKIHFLHNVESVVPPSVNRDPKVWLVKVRDLVNDVVFEKSYDGVMVCNGHYFEPSLPNLPGQESFGGQQLHSHDYRTPEPFKDKRVVVFGAGPSGMDLALEISKKATRVILSHHLKDPILTKFPNNVVQKPDIKCLTENDAVFEDGTKEKVDIIFYCTGYKYSFPFLDPKCNIKVIDNMVLELWKHVISIDHPSLAFIGIPFYVCAFSMFDLQVRFVLEFWKMNKLFPYRECMLEDYTKERIIRFARKKYTKRQFHMMGPLQGDYYNDLADSARIERLPAVLTKLHNESSQRFLEDLVHYREDRYRIVDDENFVEVDENGVEKPPKLREEEGEKDEVVEDEGVEDEGLEDEEAKDEGAKG